MNATLFFSNLKYNIRKPYVKIRNRILAKRYPWLLPYSATEKKFDYSYLMAEPDVMGWNNVIFYPMMEDIRRVAKRAGIINQLHTADYKSKYGGLRFYLDGTNDEINDIVHGYEILTENICEICGEPDVGCTSGWITPICKKCYEHNKYYNVPYEEAIKGTDRMPDFMEYRKFEGEKTIHYKIDITRQANKIRRRWNLRHPFRRKTYA